MFILNQSQRWGLLVLIPLLTGRQWCPPGHRRARTHISGQFRVLNHHYWNVIGNPSIWRKPLQAQKELHSNKVEYNPGPSFHEATGLTTATALPLLNFRPVGRKGTEPLRQSALTGCKEISPEDALSPLADIWRP